MLYIFIIIALFITLFLIALERERQRRAKHRAQTTALLAYVAALPSSRVLARAEG